MPVSVPFVPSRLALARSMIAWMPGAAPSIVANASTNEFGPRLPSRRRGRSDHSGHCAQLRRDLLRVAAVLDEDVERLHHAGADPGVGELVDGRRSPCRCRGSTSAALRSRSAAFPRPASTATITRPTAATATGRRSTKRAQRPQAPSSGWPRSMKRRGITRTRLIRCTEHGEHRRQQGERGEHRDDRDQHAADAHPAQQAAAAR